MSHDIYLPDIGKAARLFPVSSKKGPRETEMRTTAALLSVVAIVRSFSRELLSPLGASDGRTATVEAYTEPVIVIPGGKRVRPDGLIRVTSRGRTWTVLVEVKTGTRKLTTGQLDKYEKAARHIKADAVLTISNTIGVGNENPSGKQCRSNSKVKLHHLAWSEVLTSAKKCHDHIGVDDPEQQWILGELIRYLGHKESGVSQLTDMGASWTKVRNGARQKSLRHGDAAVGDIAVKWVQLVSQLGLRFVIDTGADVHHGKRTGKGSKAEILDGLRHELAESQTLAGSVIVSGAVAPITFTANLGSNILTIESLLSAPSDKTNPTRVSWLKGELKNAPSNLIIESRVHRAKEFAHSATLSEALADSKCLYGSKERDITEFKLSFNAELGSLRRNQGKTLGFIDSIERSVVSFYENVLQPIETYVPPAPKVLKTVTPETSPGVGSESSVTLLAG